MGKGLPGGRAGRQAALTIGPNQTGLSSRIDDQGAGQQPPAGRRRGWAVG
eukprot:COSAG01_NODE_1927_length_8881_cov_51.056479_5_plen_50_part_00